MTHIKYELKFYYRTSLANITGSTEGSTWSLSAFSDQLIQTAILSARKLSYVPRKLSTPCYRGCLNRAPQWNFSQEFPEIFSQNHICYHWLSLSGISKMMVTMIVGYSLPCPISIELDWIASSIMVPGKLLILNWFFYHLFNFSIFNDHHNLWIIFVFAGESKYSSIREGACQTILQLLRETKGEKVDQYRPVASI